MSTLASDSLVFARRNAAHIRQIPEKLLDVTLQPLMFVLLFFNAKTLYLMFLLVKLDIGVLGTLILKKLQRLNI